MVNQIEVNPLYQQRELIDYCNRNGIIVQGWGPLGHGRVFKKKLLCDISQKYNKSIAQLCLKWCLQIGVLPVAKASSDQHMKSNLDLFDFEVAAEDMTEIAKLDTPDGHFDYYSYVRQMNY